MKKISQYAAAFWVLFTVLFAYGGVQDSVGNFQGTYSGTGEMTSGSASTGTVSVPSHVTIQITQAANTIDQIYVDTDFMNATFDGASMGGISSKGFFLSRSDGGFVFEKTETGAKITMEIKGDSPMKISADLTPGSSNF